MPEKDQHPEHLENRDNEGGIRIAEGQARVGWGERYRSWIYTKLNRKGTSYSFSR